MTIIWPQGWAIEDVMGAIIHASRRFGGGASAREF